MKAEIIAIGSELLLGQIANTNAQFISEQLALIGIPVYYHSVVGDNSERLCRQLEIARERSDIIIFTGGLGPTKDDLTKETLASFLHKKLVLDQEAMARITQFFTARQAVMTPNNERQAIILEGAKVFPNDHGMAPGMALEHQGRQYILFPGPPHELYPMFRSYAIPYLSSLLPEQKVVHSKVMRFMGIGESSLEVKLQDLLDNQSNPTIAPLAKEGEVTLRITSFSSSIEEAEQSMAGTIAEIKARVGEFLYGWDEDTLEEVVARDIRARGMKLAVAESCTGGLLSQLFTSLEGASTFFEGGVICYSNKVKASLGVSEDELEQHGAVSSKTAELLAIHIKEQLQTDIGISVTGVAGPALQENNPVGLVYLGISTPSRVVVKELQLSGSRKAIQRRAAKLAMFQLWNELKKGD